MIDWHATAANMRTWIKGEVEGSEGERVQGCGMGNVLINTDEEGKGEEQEQKAKRVKHEKKKAEGPARTFNPFFAVHYGIGFRLLKMF